MHDTPPPSRPPVPQSPSVYGRGAPITGHMASLGSHGCFARPLPAYRSSHRAAARLPQSQFVVTMNPSCLNHRINEVD